MHDKLQMLVSLYIKQHSSISVEVYLAFTLGEVEGDHTNLNLSTTIKIRRPQNSTRATSLVHKETLITLP